MSYRALSSYLAWSHTVEWHEYDLAAHVGAGMCSSSGWHLRVLVSTHSNVTHLSRIELSTSHSGLCVGYRT